ncbi:hypothetical protein NicSoilB4_15720 [Arthrobacter sp. NicSoilB4]|nr:hypothetical protein NicSoilB4_15720 [Arthrobacter sp. NicSoilB4]
MSGRAGALEGVVFGNRIVPTPDEAVPGVGAQGCGSPWDLRYWHRESSSSDEVVAPVQPENGRARQ